MQLAIAHSKSGASKMVIVAILVAVIVLASVAAAYIAFKPSSSTLNSKTSPTPTPTTSPTSTPKSSPVPTATPHPTPTPTAAPTTQPTTAPTSAPTASPTPTATPAPTPTPSPGNTHTVDYTTMMTGSETDYWSVSVSSGYTLTLQDSMTVSSGSQQLGIWAYNSANANATNWIWNVNYMNSTFAYYWVNTGGGNGPEGYISCVNGIVYVVASSTSIEFIGTSSVTVSTSFQNVVQIVTENGGDGVSSGLFNGGTLQMSYTTG